MKNLIEEHNNAMTTQINDSVNKTLKEFQTTLIKTVEKIIVKK